MKNISTWLHNYQNLSFEQQYEVAKAIVVRLSNYQHQFTQKDDDMTKVMDFFKRIINSMEQKQTLSKKGLLLKKFEELSPAYKDKALKSIIEIIESAIREQEQENKEETCEREGHLFGEWEQREYQKSNRSNPERHSYYDHNGYLRTYITCENEDYTVTEWARTCKRCGYTERTSAEPEEHRAKIKAIYKKARIKALNDELAELTKEDN